MSLLWKATYPPDTAADIYSASHFLSVLTALRRAGVFLMGCLSVWPPTCFLDGITVLRCRHPPPNHSL